MDFPIDPNTLPDLPAPMWFIQFFKVIGFFLHMIPMGLWLAGLPIALIAARQSDDHSKRWASRFFKQLPVIMAFGINFGIVPLLFTQLAYYKNFYSATILMAWPWMSVIALVVLAYYGLYFLSFRSQYVVGDVPKKKSRLTSPWAVGVVVSLLLIAVGTLFAGAMTLMVQPVEWAPMLQEANVAGATIGVKTNHGDPQMWARFGLISGLSILTTAAWIVFDAGWFTRKEDSAYRRWASQFAFKVSAVGVVWTIIFGSIYLGLLWKPDVRELMFAMPLLPLTLLIGAVPTLPAIWLFLKRNEEVTPALGAIALGVQSIVLLMNAIGRQIVQNIEAGRLVDIFQIKEAVQWSPLIAFLVTFVFGLVVIAWMIAQLRHVEPVSE